MERAFARLDGAERDALAGLLRKFASGGEGEAPGHPARTPRPQKKRR